MRGRSFGAVLDGCAMRFAKKPALSSGERDWTYGEAIGSLRAVGRALRRQGLRPGDRVGILIGDSPELVLSLYGALWAGITVVPLNVRLSVGDHAYMLEDCEARALIVDEKHLEHGARLLSQVDVEMVFGTSPGAVLDDGQALDVLAGREEIGPQAFADIDPGSEVWIQYTGGTTGRPKGAIHSHETMLAALFGCALEFDIRP